MSASHTTVSERFETNHDRYFFKQIYFQTLSTLDLSSEQIKVVQRNGHAILELHERISASLEEIQSELNWKALDKNEDQITISAGKVADVFIREVSYCFPGRMLIDY